MYRGSAGDADNALALVATTDAITSYTATNLRSGYAYKFGVVAIDAANLKSAMQTVTLTTGPATDTAPPAAPSSTSVVATAFSSTRIDVVWGASSSSDVAYYQVIRDGVLVGTVERPNSPRFSDNGLTPASAHSYTIAAVDSAGNRSSATTAKSASTTASGVVKVPRGPYLSNVTGSSGVISWWSNIPTAGSVSIDGRTLSDPQGAVQHHLVTVSGLSPGTSYPYTVTSGSATATGSLRTAAPPGQTFSFAAIGDFGGGSGAETQNAVNIGTAGTQFIQTLGDNIYPSAGLPDPNFSTIYSDFDGRFFKQFNPVVKSQAFFPANGNKEYYGDGAFWSNFPMPGSNHSWYSYDWGDAHILVLDSEQPFTSGSAQYTFAQTDLAAHQGSAWRIVAIQRPPYSSTTTNSSSVPVRQYLVPLFQNQHVDLVLSGNSHNYERTFPLIDGNPVTSGGITYVVSGAGGNGFNVFQLAAPAYSAFRESSYGEFVKVTVSPTALVVNGIRADTNSVFDSVTLGQPTVDTTAPTAPTGLTAGQPGSTSVPLSWTAATDNVGVTGYEVYRAGALIKTVTGTAYTDTGLTPSTSYSYTVKAVDAAGNNSLASNTATATTTAAADITAPTAPSGLTVGQPGSSSVPLTWTAATDNVGVTGYEVYRNSGATPVKTVTGATYTDTGLTPSTSYSYTVKAVDAAGNKSPASNTATATTAAGGNVITLAPTNDATIDPVTTNSNTTSRIKVDGSAPTNDLLVKFVVPTSCTPTSATLLLTVGSGSNDPSSRGGDLYATSPNDVNAAWVESSVTWATAPAKDTAIPPVSLGAVAAGVTYPINVSTLVPTAGGTVTIRGSSASADGAGYFSKEGSTTSGPRLQLACG
ncbi:fibronectin type III domain-containing protein [Nakamurella sp. GG22]